MIWRTIKQKHLSDTEQLSIAEIKNQHWEYGIESQLRWMRDNIQVNDIHLIGEEITENGVKLKAYCTITKLNVKIDEKCYEFLGVGGVCVDKSIQHSGIGKQLMNAVNEYISGKEKNGILLCKDTLRQFYQKCGWKLVNYQTATVAGKEYELNIMFFNNYCSCTQITIDRNF